MLHVTFLTASYTSRRTNLYSTYCQLISTTLHQPVPYYRHTFSTDFHTHLNPSSLSLSIQRLQSLVPSEEELSLIRKAQAESPHSPLAPAELCLLTLGQITYLSPRLQLWAFALDYDTLERVGGV